MSGPVPGTPTPWVLDGPDWFGDYNIQWKHGVDTDTDHLVIAAVVSNLRPADDVAANAAAIVHRVNNWDALEAERDALQARVDALVVALQRAFDHVVKDAPNWFEDGSFEQKAMLLEVEAARTALSLAQGEAA